MDFAIDGIGGIGSFTVVHSDIGTSLSECDSDCGSDSATAASYKGDSILQIFHGFILRFVLCPVNPSAPHNPHLLLTPTGTEYHADMSRIFPQCLDANPSDRSARSDVLLRQEPDEEEDDEEDEGNVTDDEGDDDEEDDGGYSVQVCRFCQW